MTLSIKPHIKFITTLIFTNFFLSININIYAIHKEIIANYNNSEISEIKPIIFKNRPYFITAGTNQQGENILVTKNFDSDNKNLSKNSSLIADILGIAKTTDQQYFYYLDIKANDNLIFVLLTAHDQNNNTTNTYLIQSSDGKLWSINNSFTKLDDHNCANSINSKNNLISLSCNNQDQAERFFFSKDNGQTWITTKANKKLKLSSDIIIADNIFFIKSLNNQLFFIDNQGQFIKAHIDSLKKHAKDFALNDIINIFASRDVLFAQAEYQLTLSHPNSNSRDRYQNFLWMSQDNGVNWSLLQNNLPNQTIIDLKAHGEFLHILTVSNESSNDSLYYYNINLHDLIHNNSIKFKPLPLAVFPHSSGYFLDYQSILRSYKYSNNSRLEFIELKK